MASPKRPTPSPLVERFVGWAFHVINAIDQRRERHPYIFNTGIGVLSILFASWIWWLIDGDYLREFLRAHPFPAWARLDPGGVPLQVATTLLMSVFSYLLLSLLVPFFLISQRAVAVQAMGMCWASVNEGAVQELLPWYLASHPQSDVIRIICISGHSLFGSEGHLESWAKRGKLDVIMPVSDSGNPTVHERWNRYSDALKGSEYKDVDALVKEMEEGKAVLRTYNNQLTEHDVLCMWRVIILQNYCIVQSYFPNHDGGLSDDAPAFVYTNTGQHSYYQMYVEMFYMLRKYPRREATSSS